MNNIRPGESYMGQHIRTYKPRRNVHRVINQLLTREVHAFAPGAVIVQEKEYPDVSFWQGDIDWDLMASKTDAVGIRAGQRNWPDTKFIRNYTEAKRRNLRRLVYWFCDDRESPGNQAKLLLNLIGNDPPEMGIFPDWETSYGGAFRGLPNVVAMMEAIERGLPMCEVGLYTGFWWFIEHSNVILNINQYNYLKNKPLWLAWYTDNPAEVLIPGAVWTKLTHWQKGTPPEGRAHGADSEEIDKNVPNMTNPEFYQRYRVDGTQPEPTPEPEPEPNPETGETMQGKVTSATNIRNSPPGGVYQDIGDMVAGDIITSDRFVLVSGVKWYHLTNAHRNNQPIITLGGLTVSQRTDCWAYGPNIEPIGEPEPEPVSGFLPLDINITENVVTVSGPNVQTVSVELRPK